MQRSMLAGSAFFLAIAGCGPEPLQTRASLPHEPRGSLESCQVELDDASPSECLPLDVEALDARWECEMATAVQARDALWNQALRTRGLTPTPRPLVTQFDVRDADFPRERLVLLFSDDGCQPHPRPRAQLTRDPWGRLVLLRVSAVLEYRSLTACGEDPCVSPRADPCRHRGTEPDPVAAWYAVLGRKESVAQVIDLEYTASWTDVAYEAECPYVAP